MKMPEYRFGRAVRRTDSIARSVIVATCGNCGAEADLSDSTAAHMSPEAAAKKFVQRGWFIGRTSKRDRCPKCNVARPSPAAEPVLIKEPEPMPTIVPPAAEPPREPSREEKRRVMEALEEHYNTPRQAYESSFSDDSLAKKLDVPRAWVARIRDEWFGPDVNLDTLAAAANRDKAITGLDARLAALEDKAMAIALEADQLRKELVTLRGRAAA